MTEDNDIETRRARMRAKIERMRQASDTDPTLQRVMLQQLGAMARPYRRLRAHRLAMKGDPVAQGQVSAQMAELARKIGQRLGRGRDR